MGRKGIVAFIFETSDSKYVVKFINLSLFKAAVRGFSRRRSGIKNRILIRRWRISS